MSEEMNPGCSMSSTSSSNLINSPQNGVEKIKTIGDAYMAACGAPTPDPRHKHTAMRFSCALLMAMERLNVKLDSNLSIRIGLHSGRVVAGSSVDKKYLRPLETPSTQPLEWSLRESRVTSK